MDAAPAPAAAPDSHTNLYLLCSGSEAGSYLRLIDFVYHSTLGLRAIKKRKRLRTKMDAAPDSEAADKKSMDV